MSDPAAILAVMIPISAEPVVVVTRKLLGERERRRLAPPRSMARDRRPHLKTLVRALRKRLAAWARVRRDRLAAGYEAASSRERSLIGALLLRPRAIKAVARARPPVCFSDNVALTLMRGLVCASARGRTVGFSALIQVLADHDVLDLVGGPATIRSLVTPGPELNDAVREVEGIVEQLSPADQDAIVNEESLDDTTDWRTGESEPAAVVGNHPEDPVTQLALFANVLG